MKEYPTLSFENLSRFDGAEFPQCCTNGFFMTYNTHLRDPVKAYFAQQALRDPHEVIRSGLHQAKKKFPRK